tara:strand:+ start:397 stop:984 length:588 start_codon:yes stop_codon:yes gene_type:complete
MWDVLLDDTELQKIAKPSEVSARKQLALAMAAEAATGQGLMANKLLRMRNQRIREREQKTAGLFMKPSDIAGHTNLANELENKLNGQAPADDPMFKKANNAAIGGAVGAVAGGLNAYRYSKKQKSELQPVEDVKGVWNKTKRKYKEIDNATIDFAQKNPKSAIAIGAVSGGATGAFIGSDLLDRYRRIKRQKPSK